ncbi:MAG: hypothetical protein DIU75_002535 [Mycolicibacterium hassiacum]|jgi:hypothetical protein
MTDRSPHPLAGLLLRQHDGVTCGPTVAVVSGGLLDPARLAAWADPDRFADEQRRVHRRVNRIWPRRLGTTPPAMARAMNEQGAAAGVRYRWRLYRGCGDPLTDVLAAARANRPVAMLVGGVIPRHWVLIGGLLEPEHPATPPSRSPGDSQTAKTSTVPRPGDPPSRRVFWCFEPSSGQVRAVDVAAVRAGRLTGLGFPRPFAFVVPAPSHSNV